MKFKVGDTVEIICADMDSSMPNTVRKIGQVGKIVRLSGVASIPYSILFETDNVFLNFMEKEIALYRKVGQQLEFKFMEK